MNFTLVIEKIEEIFETSTENVPDYDTVPELELEEEDVGLHGNHLAVALIIFPSIIGVAFSIISLYIIYKTPFLKNAFGYLCCIHTIGEGSVLLIFIFWSTPFSYM
uniref:7TM GPCR serpentine receptor class x (Srx) domain-containing protein n=1 Tax=Panagrolaimus sp. ES5 TaxID=591445 RepID=A0AC34FHG9_9BILA